jgi:hypothetical protein
MSDNVLFLVKTNLVPSPGLPFASYYEAKAYWDKAYKKDKSATIQDVKAAQ